MAYRMQIEVIGVQYESSYEHQGLLFFFIIIIIIIIIQEHPTTKCFQIRQKCIKWFSLCFRSLLG